MHSDPRLVKTALSLLGVERLVLAIHDQSFPSLDREEIGRGSPYSVGGLRFLRFIGHLGFNGVQLGPQGKTSLSNPSPYDGTLFSQNELSISLLSLVEDERLSSFLPRAVVDKIVSGLQPGTTFRNRASYEYAWSAQREALAIAHSNFLCQPDMVEQWHADFALWRKQQADWLAREGLFEALTIEYGSDDWRLWSDLDQRLVIEQTEEARARAAELQKRYANQISFFEFCQFLVHLQHQNFRKQANNLGIKLFADLQIGFSARDVWGLRNLFLPRHRLGAPPSRTNPDGQPWGYPLLDPALYFSTRTADDIKDKGQVANYGPALNWFARRIDKLLLDFDGVRIDHPHGVVCPWVYKTSDPDALHAVQNGARLFESPDVAYHLDLSSYAIARPEQVDRNVQRYADGWVKELSDDQVDRYAVIVDLIQNRIKESGLDPADIVCEVLSSCPYPLRRVLARNGLGRFRVTQKANPRDLEDVYRTANALPPDWVMVGTHDTNPIWLVVDNWNDEQRAQWAEYLAARLEPDRQKRKDKIADMQADRALLVEAMFADLFVGPARNVSIFFTDLLGITEVYNKPGIVCDTNWMVSVPNDYEMVYAQRIGQRLACNLPRALAMALRAKLPVDKTAASLADQLDALAQRYRSYTERRK